jgi:hypothetical protein
VELGFFHACYPEGVQDKVYRLRILHRSRHQLLALQLEGDGRMLRLGAITRAWLARQLHVPMLVTLGAGTDDNYGEQLDRLAANDIPPELRVPFHIPWELEETIMNCALRFDGYAWLEAHPDCNDEANGVLPERHLRELVLDPDAEVNFAAFFLLQRFLHKWGGEMLPPSHKHHTAYRFLFLHLYALPTPARWVSREYEEKWESIPAGRLAAAASAVRRVLLAADLRAE